MAYVFHFVTQIAADFILRRICLSTLEFDHMKIFRCALVALTVLCGFAAQALAEGPQEDALRMMREIMAKAQATGGDVTPSPTPTEVSQPPIDVPTTDQLDEDPADSEWPAGLRRADPNSDPVGAKLDAVLVGGRRLRKEVKGLGAKVEDAIVRVDRMQERQTASLASIGALEQRVDGFAGKMTVANGELAVANGKLAVAEQKVTAQERQIQQLGGEVGNLRNGLAQAQGSLAAVNARLDRPRLTNLFGLLGTR